MARRKDGTAYGKSPRPRTNARETHGYHAARRFLAEYGTRSLDMRTRAGKDLAAWKDAYIEDLGGLENVTTGQLTFLDMAATLWFLYQGLRVKVVAEAGDGQLEKETIDLLRRVGDSLAKYLTALGLERRSPPSQDLTAYIEERYAD
jgi:hypothetical protein